MNANPLLLRVPPTIKRVELINKKEFVAATLDDNVKTFVVYVAILLAAPTLAMQVFSFWQAQVGLLLADKAFIKVLSKYLDYTDVFLFDFVM